MVLRSATSTSVSGTGDAEAAVRVACHNAVVPAPWCDEQELSCGVQAAQVVVALARSAVPGGLARDLAGGGVVLSGARVVMELPSAVQGTVSSVEDTCDQNVEAGAAVLTATLAEQEGCGAVQSWRVAVS